MHALCILSKADLRQDIWIRLRGNDNIQWFPKPTRGKLEMYSGTLKENDISIFGKREGATATYIKHPTAVNAWVVPSHYRQRPTVPQHHLLGMRLLKRPVVVSISQR